MNRSGTGWLLLAGPLLLATSSAQANYSPNDWRQYQLTGESSRQLAARITEITYELKARSSNAPYQQLRVYRRFDWQSSDLAALAEQQCGEPQLKVDAGWQIRFVRCEDRIPAGKLIPASSYDFGYGLKQGRWEQLAGTPTAQRQDRLPLPQAIILGQSERELDRCELNAQGRCAESEWHYQPQDWQQLQVLEETPSERDGRLEQIFFRLQPVAGSQAAAQVSEIHVWRRYQWQLDQLTPQQECDEPQERKEGSNTIRYRICRQVIHAGSEVQVTLQDSGYQYPVAGGEWQPLPESKEWQESRVLNRPIVLASKEEQLECRRANGRLCSEPEQPDVDLLDSDAAKLVADVSGQNSPAWQADYGHDDAKLMAVVRGMRALLAANQPTHPTMDKLLYYVRAHNYHGGVGKESDQAARALAGVMIDLLNHPLLLGAEPQEQAGTVLEAWSVAAQGQLGQAAFRQSAAPMLAQLNQALGYAVQHAAQINGHKPWADGLFELLNLVDQSASYGQQADFSAAVLQQEATLRQSLLQLGLSELALWKQRDGSRDLFIFNNILDAHSRLYQMMRYLHHTSPDKAIAYRQQLDRDVITIMRQQGLVPGGQHPAAMLEEVSLTLSSYYLTYTDRTSEACVSGEFAGLCTPIRMEDILPFEHTCSPTLRLRAQDLTQAQAEGICRELGDEEQRFHQQMETGWQPVADDHNEALELVIFNSSADWGRYGSALFGVSTDNGGIYIEGDPARPGNQARFFAYEAEWKRPAFQVWNLRHEYVHYLDGRFNQYGSFGHYPLNRTTWWAEGIAEYIAHGQCFARGLDNVANRPANQRPTLAAILHLDYEQGGEMVYSWSYTVHRFLNDTGRGASWLALAQALRNPDRQQAMSDFEGELDRLIANDSDAYQAWLARELLPWWQANKESDACKGNDSAH
ncbi:collagenase [Aeromonas veronii]|uniref:collagenase n=1 Tax=Aeromonas veronii TaxID=654 RepID=UPI001119C278|nr:collagenase [Aeromonas veronii]MCX0423359.1 collagenase [Aeromonas veronii]TNI70957.1 collagenase [Aeromonas veronii]WIJ39898.1 collagenase [Aeromonas veronii]